tara:strand:- start:1210 stop:1359 length:150 start_codon:yes stop_codon:yes gene_type:complete
MNRKEFISEFELIVDHDGCECDNCHRWRAYSKNPEKEIMRYKQKREAKL